MRIALALFSVLIATPSYADTISRCSMVIDGKAWIKGPCTFDALDDSGSFVLQQEGSEPVSFAYIFVDDRELGPYGWWNGDHQGSHAQEFLGELKRDGACWVNEHAKVCAYQ